MRTAFALRKKEMIRRLKSILVSFSILASASMVFASAAAANVALYLEPGTGEVPCPQEFQSQIVIDATTNQTDGSRSIITYDPKILQVTKIDLPTQNPFYPTLPVKDFATAGQITVVGLANQNGPFPSGRGPIANITFKGVATGTSKVEFVRNPNDKTKSSNVVSHTTNEDILEEVHSASYTVTGNCAQPSVGISATPRPSVGTPTSLPNAGDDSFVVILTLASVSLIAAGVIGYKAF